MNYMNCNSSHIRQIQTEMLLPKPYTAEQLLLLCVE